MSNWAFMTDRNDATTVQQQTGKKTDQPTNQPTNRRTWGFIGKLHSQYIHLGHQYMYVCISRAVTISLICPVTKIFHPDEEKLQISPPVCPSHVCHLWVRVLCVLINWWHTRMIIAKFQILCNFSFAYFRFWDMLNYHNWSTSAILLLSWFDSGQNVLQRGTILQMCEGPKKRWRGSEGKVRS